MSPARKSADEETAVDGVSVSWVEFGDRVITKKDFASKNLDHDSVEWTLANSHTAVVSEDVAAYLMTEESGFELTDKLRKAKLAELSADPAESATLPAGGSPGTDASASAGGTTSSTGSATS